MVVDDPSLDSAARHRSIRVQLEVALGPDLDRLRRLNGWSRLGELLFFSGLLAFGIASPVRPLGFLCTVVALNAYVLLLHEGMHGLLALDGRLNRLVAVVLGGFLLISFSAYKVLHIRHHRYLGDPRDPDDYDNYTRSHRLVWLMHFMRLTVGCPIYLLAIPGLACRHGSPGDRRQIAVDYIALALAYGALGRLVAPDWLLWHWLLPLVVVGSFTNLRGLSQHGLTEARDPLLASRSMHLPGPFAFLLLQENLHLEHHLFPEVPSYHLADLHRRIFPMLPRALVSRSYFEFLWEFLKATPSMDRRPIGLIMR